MTRRNFLATAAAAVASSALPPIRKAECIRKWSVVRDGPAAATFHSSEYINRGNWSRHMWSLSDVDPARFEQVLEWAVRAYAVWTVRGGENPALQHMLHDLAMAA